MRTKLYHFLVNKHAGIKERYHRVHDGVNGIAKIYSWFYLIWLNFCYYVLFCHFLGEASNEAIYENKKLPLHESESALAAKAHISVADCVEKLMAYDVISFDIFDTLIFRPFSEPTDLFFFLGEQFGILDFKRIRMGMEQKEREECYKKHGHTEIILQDIWNRIERETGIPADKGIIAEQELEMQFCYANPYMLEVFTQLRRQGKQIIIVSDMYLPKSFLHELLEQNGYHGTHKIYVSCEHQKNKANGSLFELVREEVCRGKKAIHVGDNPTSDIAMAGKNGFDTFCYPNVNKDARSYRPYDMSPVVGGAYRGIVNTYLHCSIAEYSMEYEYGFVYGGIFALGYCNFIHEYCRGHQIDKILFLSRDGDVLKQVYDSLFQGENTEYAYWSRVAATKLMAAENRYDYFRRFLYHKVNQGKSVEKILKAMELDALLEELPEEISRDRLLTDRNVESVRGFIEEHWQKVIQIYDNQMLAAKEYYQTLLQGCRQVCAVDIGWAGSGAVSLDYLVRRVWNIPCQVIGLVAGTNTIHNAEPDTSEIQLQTGALAAYLYSSGMNRDLLKKHDPNRNYNVYWELLLSSPTRQFKGFYFDDNGKVAFDFGSQEANVSGIEEIQKGILDFVDCYQRHFNEFPYMYQISGRDAYAPMLVAASHGEAYLKKIEEKFTLKIGVGD